MARIEKVELRMVDLAPKVKRTDAIQSFVSQETPMVTITDADGAIGTGYSYTIGTGGSSVMRLLRDHLAPRIIGRDHDRRDYGDRDCSDRHRALGPAREEAETAAVEARRRRQGPLRPLHDGRR